MAVAIRPRVATPSHPRAGSRGLTSTRVWQELGEASFAVVGYVTPRGEARSSGVVFKTAGRRLYFAVAPDSWKAQHIASSHEVSVTVPVRRGGVLALLWPIPPATISFHAMSVVHPPATFGRLPKDLEALLPARRREEAVVIEVIPYGEFLTYGIGVPLMSMAKPELARAVVPVLEPGAEPGRRPAAQGGLVYGLMAVALAAAATGIFVPIASLVALAAVVGVVLAARKHVTVPHRASRLVLFALESFIALTAIQGGAGLLRTSFDLPLEWLNGSPFGDYWVPGVTLLVVVGGAGVLAAATAFVRRRWALSLAAMAGVLMAGYEVVEILSIDRNVGSDLAIVLAAQLVWFAAGVVVVALSGSLWLREYVGTNRHAQGDLIDKEVWG